jgi:predicted ArsR family transcriptional regulator
MSAAAVRHHLTLLVADGRVTMIGAQRKERRGRPVKVYRLSEKSLGDNLAMLSDALLSERLGKISNAKREVVLGIIGKELSDKIGLLDGKMPAAKKLALLMEYLNAHHYQAGWEAGREGPRILFGHCPYAAIIDKHPELCRMDAMMLSHELDADAYQVSKIDQKQGGSTHCIFTLR